MLTVTLICLICGVSIILILAIVLLICKRCRRQNEFDVSFSSSSNSVLMATETKGR